MLKKLSNVVFLSFLGIVSLFSMSSPVSAADVTATETCNVQVRFTATVPDSVQQGKSFTITNITVQPMNSYGMTVSSSVFTMSANNTSSSTYSQNFVATNPTPTTGHDTYVGIYPNWSLNATGAVGSLIGIKLVQSVTVVQGYGTVTCNFSQTLALITITAPSAASTSPSPSPSSSTKPKGSSSPSSSPSPSKSSTPTTTPSPTTTPKTTSPDTSVPTDEQSVTVVPLNVEVKDSSGKRIQGATVTLDGSKKMETDNVGRATFSNVLTGGHSIVVAYKNEKVSQNIKVTADDVGGIISVTLPSSQLPLGVILAASSAGLAAVGGAAAGFVLLRRKRNLAQPASTQTLPTDHLTYIPGVMDAGSIIEGPTGYTMFPDRTTPSAQATVSVPPVPEPIVAEPAPVAVEPVAPAATLSEPIVEAPAIPVTTPASAPAEVPHAPTPSPAPIVEAPATPVAETLVTPPAPTFIQPQPVPVLPPAAPTLQATPAITKF